MSHAVTTLDQLMPIQREAVIATAAAYLMDPEDLAQEWASLLLDKPSDPVIPVEPGDELAVKNDLTAATEPDCPEPETYSVTFYAAPTPWESS